MKRMGLVILLIVLIFGFIGCSSNKNRIDGAFIHEVHSDTSGVLFRSTTYTFSKNGKFTYDYYYNMSNFGTEDTNYHDQGTYELNPGKLVLTAKYPEDPNINIYNYFDVISISHDRMELSHKGSKIGEGEFRPVDNPQMAGVIEYIRK